MTTPTISDHHADALSVQDYSGSVRIAGVEIVDLRVLNDDGGSFMEIARLTDGLLEGFEGVEPRQMNYSLVMPGAVKAWHLHMKQEDVWFVPPEQRLLLGLWDCRAGSPTEDDSMRFVLGGGRARLVRIPQGVAHGCANLGPTPASIIYFVTQQFDLVDPDEHRLPWDHFGAEFWEMVRG